MESSSTHCPETPRNPVIVGLYGLPGAGKSFLLSNNLKFVLDPRKFVLYEGSDKIASLVSGGLEAFHTFEEEEKVFWRERAIDEVSRQSAALGKAAVVTGHYMFWHDDNEPSVAWTRHDSGTYTHVIYLAVTAARIAQRRRDDTLRSRPEISIDAIQKWQETEIAQLSDLCRRHGILFTLVSDESPSRVLALLLHFRQDSVDGNSARAIMELDRLVPNRERLETMLVLDADKTLAAEDAGTLFWQILADSQPSARKKCPLQELFGGPMGYSDQAFRQATLLYEEAATDEEYERLCAAVASSIDMYPEFVSLLRSAAAESHVGAVVVTCGLARVWEMILEREGLSSAVKVLGGGRLANGYTVTPAVKAAVVSQLRNSDQLHVMAFGDSPLDLPMLKEADEAIVAVGDVATRSRSMDAALAEAIDTGFRARQVLLSKNATQRLNDMLLPPTSLSELVMSRRNSPVVHSTDTNAARLLMTPTRDAAVAGPALRRAHREVGRYLAIQHLSDVMGLEDYEMRHVQGSVTNGHRLKDEERTLIVALMRGGEPLALGVNDVFPRAMFLHADSASSVDEAHLHGMRSVILVDSVVNTGKTLLLFIERIHQLEPGMRVFVVAAVVQAEAVSRRHALAVAMERHNVRMVSLRLSDNKFTGTKGTDTGNRLFNTTHLK
ncbi:hypothetical protein L249_3834 [Ophiocordyceps polyrhachis-furcata BCC 54312]|uniref:Phosphoribosyltransferase domain-containing protein n=1 Tax=Ophiocordyceps polyrhachis-furcata BCC 54312 TaxID=1330021 RepID=A0A367L6K2_9HYPO|nr:hypothetical protein L249_3834 [Ophiocordyceps polyrhachis-furcata BCC 54312]